MKIICPLSTFGGIYWQMQEPGDISLLREYTERHSEAAFAALVERHMPVEMLVVERAK